jgi:hypothetical protein
MGWQGRCAYILTSKLGGLTVAEVVDALPGVDELRSLQTMDTSWCTAAMHTMGNGLLMLAAVCEKLGQHEKTGVYAAACLETDIAKGGTPSDRDIPHQCCSMLPNTCVFRYQTSFDSYYSTLDAGACLYCTGTRSRRSLGL